VIEALLLQKSLKYVLDNLEKLISSTTEFKLTPMTSTPKDIEPVKEEKKEQRYKFIGDDDDDIVNEGGAEEAELSFYRSALKGHKNVTNTDIPLLPGKQPAAVKKRATGAKLTDSDSKQYEAYSKSLEIFEEAHATFTGTRTISNEALGLVYGRNALLNILQSAPTHAIFQNGFEWFVRVIEHSIPMGLEVLKAHLIERIRSEAKVVTSITPPSPNQGILMYEKAPTVSQLLQELLYQLLLVSRSSSKASSQNEGGVILGTSANPRLALFLLDLFAYICSDFADKQMEGEAAQLKQLRPHLFAPTITGLIFEAIPSVAINFRYSSSSQSERE
jgi:hypothetical protein